MKGLKKRTYVGGIYGDVKGVLPICLCFRVENVRFRAPPLQVDMEPLKPAYIDYCQVNPRLCSETEQGLEGIRLLNQKMTAVTQNLDLNP